MADTTTKNQDKVKMLDQMLEDIAGDEFDEYDEAENGASSGVKRFVTDEEFSDIDNIH